MGRKKRHTGVKLWHEQRTTPWPANVNRESQHEPLTWAHKYLELADLMMKLAKGENRESCRTSKAA